MPIDWLDIQDPLVRRIILAAAGFILLVLVLRVIGRRRERAAWARRRAELHRTYEQVRLEQEEIRELAARIEATSSTSRIAGFSIVRQIETVFTDGRPSSAAAVELAKALAARKGANALINLHTQQTPAGKWVASGDAVVVRAYGRRPQTEEQRRS